MNIAFFSYFRLNQTIAMVISTTKMRPINKSNLVLVMAHDSPVKTDIWLGPMAEMAESCVEPMAGKKIVKMRIVIIPTTKIVRGASHFINLDI
jgi:hypothetical protein